MCTSFGMCPRAMAAEGRVFLARAPLDLGRRGINLRPWAVRCLRVPYFEFAQRRERLHQPPVTLKRTQYRCGGPWNGPPLRLAMSQSGSHDDVESGIFGDWKWGPGRPRRWNWLGENTAEALSVGG